MKKYLLLLLIAIFSLEIYADHTDIIFENQVGTNQAENMIPVTGTKDDDKLTLTFDKADNVHMTVLDKYGSVVYQNQINSYGTRTVGVSLNGYQKGQYSINMVDTQGKTAVANFEIK